MTYTDLSPPPVGPVSLEAAKTFLRVDHDHEDALLTRLIAAAGAQVETSCGLSLIARPQRLTKPTRGRIVYLNRTPVTSIDAVRIDGVAQDVSANLRARPVPVNIVADGVAEIDFTAGYGPDPDDIPAPLQQAVLLIVAHLYEYRAAKVTPPLPMLVDALLMPYRGVRL